MPYVASKISDVAISKPGGGTQVSKIKREIGLENTKKVLAALIYDLRDTFNTRFTLSDGQIKMLVDTILTEYWHLKIEQITRAFHLQKMGDGIKIYETLDVKTVLSILHHYEQNICLPERHADELSHKEFIEERETSTNLDADNMRQAMDRYLKEKAKNA